MLNMDIITAYVLNAVTLGLIIILISFLIRIIFDHINGPNSRLRSKNTPPGSLGFPIIGESLQFISSYRSHELPDSFIRYRQSRYGRIFTTHLFGKPTVVSVDAEANRFILNSDGRLFVPDYPTGLTELWGKWTILMLEGGLHKRVHGVVAALLKSHELKDHLLSHIETCIAHSMHSWRPGSTVFIEEETKTISFHVTAKVLLGLDPGPRTTNLRSEFHKFIAGVASLPIRIPGTTFYKSLQARQRMVDVIIEILREREMEQKNNSSLVDDHNSKRSLDILSALMEERNAREVEEFPIEFITDNIVSFFFPSEDSIAMLMTLAVKYISECPKALQQLREENLNLIERNKGEKLTWMHYLSQLPFTHSVLTETLRLGNIVKGVIRKALVDVKIKDFVIPKGWAVFPIFRGVHLDEEIYPDANKFNPWRWQEKVALSHYTPFGGGPRYCTGIEMARLEAVIFLHHLVTKYRWEIKEPDIVTNFPFVKTRNNLPIFITTINSEEDIKSK